MLATCIRGIKQIVLLFQAECVAVHLPACSAVGAGRFAKHLLEFGARLVEFYLCPVTGLGGHMILPANVVMAMNANLESGTQSLAHDVAAAFADIRTGQQRAIQ